jgi:hypothetical protein
VGRTPVTDNVISTAAGNQRRRGGEIDAPRASPNSGVPRVGTGFRSVLPARQATLLMAGARGGRRLVGDRTAGLREAEIRQVGLEVGVTGTAAPWPARTLVEPTLTTKSARYLDNHFERRVAAPGGHAVVGDHRRNQIRRTTLDVIGLPEPAGRRVDGRARRRAGPRNK